MLAPPRLPLAFRAANTTLRPVARILPPLSLREDTVLEAARRATGLSDFGDDGFRPGLRRFLESLEEEAALTPFGRLVARGMLGKALESRLQITDWFARHPEIEAERIERPLVMVGMARTGTTILHELMAQDPDNRTPLTWEVEEPCPPPERTSYESDPRIERAERTLARTDRVIPGFKKMHPMGARLPQECVGILTRDFASMIFQISFHIPGYSRWLHEEADLSAAYGGHRRFLKLLQWRCPGRWVLKSPCHLWHLEALLGEYPDAVLVQTHRDPLRVISSLTSLGTTLRGMASDDVEPHGIAREWADANARAYANSVTARERGLLPPSRVLDVAYLEFVADPLATVRRIYAFSELDYTPEAERRMQAFLEANPPGKHGRHRYRFADTGLDAEEERERVKRYREFFDVPDEALS